MNQQEIITAIQTGKTSLGIELGSTRIKAVLLGADHKPIASGGHTWENQYENGYWTYSLDAVWAGLQDCYRDLKEDVKKQYDLELTTVGALGVSAMMHGYLPFDDQGNLLTPFRTWRNTTTLQAAEELSGLFGFNIPQRWSIAHLRQAMLNGEAHVQKIAKINTLAGYVHEMLTGEFVLGIGDASGMFPIDSAAGNYDAAMLEKFAPLAAGQPWTLSDILPKVLPAGAAAGTLTPEGAKLLDPTGALASGIPMAPPEGDAGTGMTATNAVAPRTGNVSAGTSIFAMVVMEKMLSKVYPEIDMVTTPTGKPVAMVHCNNCTSDMNNWVDMILDAVKLLGFDADMDDLYPRLYKLSLEAEKDCGGVTVYNYLSGEHITGFEQGRPVVVRNPERPFNLPNFVRAHLYSALATLAAGMEILAAEQVAIDSLIGHGGLFKTKGVGQRYLAAATGSPVCVMETAGQGGPYGMALLASFLQYGSGRTLEQYLNEEIFANTPGSVLDPDPEDAAGFKAYLDRFLKGMPVERAAVDTL